MDQYCSCKRGSEAIAMKQSIVQDLGSCGKEEWKGDQWTLYLHGRTIRGV